jgi:hypothetical protein
MITKAPKPLGVVKVPPLSSHENSASYTVTKEDALSIQTEILTYYTFPGLEDYLELPTAVLKTNKDTSPQKISQE